MLTQLATLVIAELGLAPYSPECTTQIKLCTCVFEPAGEHALERAGERAGGFCSLYGLVVLAFIIFTCSNRNGSLVTNASLQCGAGSNVPCVCVPQWGGDH